MDLTIPLLFLVYCIAYLIMYLKNNGDPFYIKHKKMVRSIPEHKYLEQEIKELEEELELADYQGVATVIIEEIKKELESKKSRLKSLYDN